MLRWKIRVCKDTFSNSCKLEHRNDYRQKENVSFTRRIVDKIVKRLWSKYVSRMAPLLDSWSVSLTCLYHRQFNSGTKNARSVVAGCMKLFCTVIVGSSGFFNIVVRVYRVSYHLALLNSFLTRVELSFQAPIEYLFFLFSKLKTDSRCTRIIQSNWKALFTRNPVSNKNMESFRMKCNFQVDLSLFLSRNIGNVSRILFQNFSFTECFHIVVLYFITVFWLGSWRILMVLIFRFIERVL